MPHSKYKRAKSRRAIEYLFKRVERRYRRLNNISRSVKLYPEIIIADALGGSAFAPRNWLTRGIPWKHWDAFAELAGVSRYAVRRAHDVADV